MPLKINRGQLGQALASYLGIKGNVEVPLDPVLLTTLQIGDLTDSPYLRYAIPVCEGAVAAAVAGQVGFGAARPGPSVALQITKIRLNNTLGVAQTASVRIATGAQMAAVVASPVVQMIDLASREAGAGALRSSAVVTTTVVASFGNIIATLGAAAGLSDTLEFPSPGVILFGDNDGGPGGLVVSDNVVNEVFNCTFFGREWPLPG